MAFSAEYIYRILDKYSAPLEKITRKTNKFQKSASRASRSINRMSEKLGNAGQRMANFRTMIGGAAITAGMFKFAQSASVMEDAMADVARVTGLTGEGLARMQERLQKLGRATGRNAEGLAAMAYEGGKLGIATGDIAEFVTMVMKTAVAFDLADEEAGRSIGSIRAKLGLTVSNVNTLMQRVNYLADNTSAAGNKMINIIERTSGTFKMLNIPPAVTAGWAAFADQVEVTPELAASGLNQMMLKMMQMPGMLKKMLKDPQNAVVTFLKRFEKMPEARRGATILKVFGTESGKFVMKTISNLKLLDKTMKIAASGKALGSMDREFANILARSSTAGKRLKQTFLDISRAIGTVFIKVFMKYSKQLTYVANTILRFVKVHPGLVKIAAVMGGLLIAVSAVVIPIGLLFSILAGGLPILSAIAAGIGAISASVVVAVGLVAAMVAWFVTMYAKSDNLRYALSNLLNALTPLWGVLKMGVGLIGKGLAGALGLSGDAAHIWGDIFANVINMLAGLIKGLFDLIGGVGGALGALSMGDFGGAWTAIKEGIGMSSAKEKAARRAQINTAEITGKIDVTASGGAKVKRADIGLNTGYNLLGA